MLMSARRSGKPLPCLPVALNSRSCTTMRGTKGSRLRRVMLAMVATHCGNPRTATHGATAVGDLPPGETGGGVVNRSTRYA